MLLSMFSMPKWLPRAAVCLFSGVADIKKLACERLNPSGAWQKLSEEAKDMVPGGQGRNVGLSNPKSVDIRWTSHLFSWKIL